MGLVDIGFPSIDKGEVIKGTLSFITTIASLTIAILAYKAASKSAIAAEKSVEISKISAIAAQQSLFNTTFEKRLTIYKAMWKLNTIFNEVDRTVGVNYKKPKDNFVSKELFDRLEELHKTLVYDTLFLPEIIQKTISNFYVNVRDEIRCQIEPSDLPKILDAELDNDLIQQIKSFKEKNHERNRELSKILQDMRQYVKAP